MKRKTVFLLTAAMAVSGAMPVTSFAAETESTAQEESAVVKDDGNPISKIVALTAADCEIIYALGAGNLVVGRGEYCNYPEEALDVTAVPSGADTNIEQIIALEPDVVFMDQMGQSTDQMQALEEAGILVVVSDGDNLDGVYNDIKEIGGVIGKESEADALVQEMQDGFAALSEQAQDKTGGSVYYEVSPLEYGLWTAGSDTFMNEIGDMLGLTNIFTDVAGWGEISEEQVLEKNPDYIITTTMYSGEGDTPVDEIKGRAGWENVTAVANDRVFNADSDSFTRPGPRLLEAAQALYAFVYGEE